jgi:hypothetical protein
MARTEFRPWRRKPAAATEAWGGRKEVMAQQSARRDRDNQCAPPYLGVRYLDLDPFRELPCRPAVDGRARGRTDGSIRLRVTAFLMFSLALKGAFSNRSSPVKTVVYVARPGHGSLRGQRGLPQHLVRSGGQALQGPQRAHVDHAPIAPPRNCLHPRPGAMRVGVFDECR